MFYREVEVEARRTLGETWAVAQGLPGVVAVGVREMGRFKTF